MSTTPGVFDETLLEKAIAFADGIAFADRINLQFQPRINALKTLFSQQTANMRELNATEKDFTVRVDWQQFCGLTVGDDVACQTCSTEPSTNAKDYTITQSKSVCYLINEPTYLTNTFSAAQATAKGLIAMEVALLNWLVQYYVAFLNVNAGVNAEGTASIGTVVGTSTQIAAAHWTAQAAIPYMIRVADYNQLTNPAALSGALLLESYLASKINSGNANGKGDAQMFDMFNPFEFDEFNLAAVNGGTDYAYLISKGAPLLVNKTYFTPEMRDRQWGKTVAYQSRFIPEIIFDLIIKETCQERDLSAVDMKLRFNGDILINPTGCDDNNTGILRFECV